MTDPFNEDLSLFDCFVDCLEADSIGLEEEGFIEAAAENNLLIIEGSLLDLIYLDELFNIPPFLPLLAGAALFNYIDDLIEYSFADDYKDDNDYKDDP